MRLLYDCGILIYGLLLRLISPFHRKAKLWVAGRKNVLEHMAQSIPMDQKPIWFHFASLGEFEQGRPVIEAIKAKYAHEKILITFFSPSGFEIRKNYSLADWVYYLPEDRPSNVKNFLTIVNPKVAIFTKYEYWFHYFKNVGTRQIPLLLVSAIFREDHIFFKSYGGFFRRILSHVTYFFTQNNSSVYLLKSIGVHNAGLAGDTRFDRVAALKQTIPSLPLIEDFVGKSQVLVAGSTWPQDEKHLHELKKRFSLWKFILAPHEIDTSHIAHIQELFPNAILYSQIKQVEPSVLRNADVLIIDSIGLLSSLYYYADIAYIGGGFGAGIHNTLEAATYGKPVMFGPNYVKFQEAIDLIELGAAFSFKTEKQLEEVFRALQIEERRKMASASAASYVDRHTGATQIIMKYLETQKILGD